MGYFQVRYDSRVVNYDCRGFIRLATGSNLDSSYLLLKIYEKMSFKYTVPGFESMTFRSLFSSHNHLTKNPTQVEKLCLGNDV